MHCTGSLKRTLAAETCMIIGNAPQMKAYTQTSLAMGLPNISNALLGLTGASSRREISSMDTMDVIEGTKTLPVGFMEQELLEVDYNGWDF